MVMALRSKIALEIVGHFLAFKEDGLVFNFRLELGNKFTWPRIRSVFISLLQEGFLRLSSMWLTLFKCRGVS